MGQILTYAAGLGAKTLIWVAAKFTEEHRAALDWLNENTVEDVSFFGLEIELWRIGNSPPAPKFNVACKLNDWSKAWKMQAGGKEGQITAHKQLQFEFWTAFKAHLEEDTSLRTQKPSYQHWLTVTIGRAGFHLNAITSAWSSVTETWSPEVRVELIMNGRSRASQIEDFIDLDVERKTDVMPGQLEPRVRQEMMHVVSSAGIEIVDTQDFVAALEQSTAQMRAYESSSAGDENATFRQHGRTFRHS